MYNLLIIEENPEQIRLLVNYIAKRFNDIRICNIEYHVEKCFDILKTNNIDIIIIDIESDENSYINLIKYLNKNKLFEYKKSIILKNKNRVENNIVDKFVLSCVKNAIEMEKVLKKLISLKKEKIDEEQIKCKIRKELNTLEYNYSYNGTKYLEEVILEIYKMNLKFDGNLSKEIYPLIAKKYQKKEDTIYCNIKAATKQMLLNNNREKLLKYLGVPYLKKKPKVKEIIIKILNKINE